MKEYIEREAVKDEILSWAVFINHPKFLSKEDTLHCIDSLPAADVAPVRHGQWIEYDGDDAGFHFCSECKGQAFNYEENGEVIEVLSRWCPHCGALMDGEETAHD